MASVTTKQGEVVLIDDDDFGLVSQYSWAKHSQRGNVYTRINGVTKYMHRLIIDAKAGEKIDHVNRDKLDNRRCNLRVCSHAEIMRRRNPDTTGFTGYKGVTSLSYGRFRAKIISQGKNYNLGTYSSERDAALAYNAAAKVLHGEFAYMNDLPSPLTPKQQCADEMYEFLESLQLDVAKDYRRDEILAKARGESCGN